jgi:cation diffusion facilitator CzcD-associated flavoprotein CzcO
MSHGPELAHLNMVPIKSIAIIGAGPAGAITVDALSQEQAFDKIRLFERREKAGGCWSVFLKISESTFLPCLGSRTPKIMFNGLQTMKN